MEPKHESHQSSAEAVRHVSDDFLLPDEDLRDARSGEWSAPRIASALGVSLVDLAGMIGTEGRTTGQALDGGDLRQRLAPVGNVLAMVRDYYGGDADRVKAWLVQPQIRLGGQSPLDALRTPGGATAIEQWIAGLWLGEGE